MSTKIAIDENNFAVTIRQGSVGEWSGYIPQFVGLGNYDLDDLADLLVNEEHIPSSRETVKLIIKAFFQLYLSEVAQNGTVRARFGALMLSPTIDGAFRSIDGAWNKAVNTLKVNINFSQAVSQFLVNVVPTIVTDDSEVLLRLFRFMDVETETPGLICGQYTFRVNGSNIYLEREGEEAFFMTANGTHYAAQLVGEASPQRVTLMLTQVPPKGCTGKLYVKSYGKNRASTDLQVDYLSATYTPKNAPVQPTITVLRSDTAADGKVKKNDAIVVHGTNLNIYDDSKAINVSYTADGEPKTGTIPGQSSEKRADELIFDGTIPNDADPGTNMTFTFHFVGANDVSATAQVDES